MPSTPTGTDTRKINRQLIGANTPPNTNPMNAPLNAAAWLMPIAMPRSSGGNASVRMAEEFAISMAAPTAWNTRITMSQIAPACPVVHVTVSTNEKNVKTANPRLKVRTRP